MRRLLAAAAALALLAGAADAANLKLVEVITSPERTETLKGMVAEYEKASGNTVEIVSLPWGQAFETVATMVAGGDIPDVMEMPDTWQALYAPQLMNLDERVAGWEHGQTLTQKTVDVAKLGADHMTMIPYGFYLRAMFVNTKLLKEAGVAAPPKTMEEFMAAAEAVSKLPGKSGYCLRGGPGGTNGWVMMAAVMNGSNEFFTPDGKSRINEPGSVAGIQFLIDMYQKGYAPKDSVNWGFNEIVAGFYSGQCAFLDQDPDALIAIAEKMPAEDFAVVPMPLGPAGKAFPTMGFAGWSVFDASQQKDAAWDLVAHLSSPESNAVWAKRVGVIPIHQGADQDPYFKTPQFAGWFEELNGEAWVPTIMPTYLEGWGYFASNVLKDSAQEALLGQKTAQQVADEWAAYLTDEQAKWKAKQ